MEEKDSKNIVIGKKNSVAKKKAKKDFEDNNINRKKKRNKKYSCKKGYQKLAFGEINDVMKLITSTDDELFEYDVKNLDFFNVSSIEKSGGKIKFEIFSRQEALDRLAKIEKDEEDFENTLSFFNETLGD